MTTADVPIEQDASLQEAPQEARAHRTKAQADRERRCIVSGEVVPEEKLIRFVAGPGGVVVPDLARKLPGRGLWVTANREAVTTAAKKGAFSRAAKAKLSAPADLADQVERLLTQRVLDGLGLLNQNAARASMAQNPRARDAARATHAGLVAEYSRAARACLPHRAYLRSLQKETA